MLSVKAGHPSFYKSPFKFEMYVGFRVEGVGLGWELVTANAAFLVALKMHRRCPRPADVDARTQSAANHGQLHPNISNQTKGDMV